LKKEKGGGSETTGTVPSVSRNRPHYFKDSTKREVIQEPQAMDGDNRETIGTVPVVSASFREIEQNRCIVFIEKKEEI